MWLNSTDTSVAALGRLATVVPPLSLRVSDLRLLRHLQSVIDLNAQVSYRTLKLRMAQQKLNRSDSLFSDRSTMPSYVSSCECHTWLGQGR